jgi:Domain of unknown function (DUF4124)
MRAVEVVAIVLGLSVINCAQATTYKWVDEKGRVHYGDHIPPEYSGQGSEELGKEGLVIRHRPSEEELRRKEAERARQEEARKAQEEARRRDKALLSTYTSAREIDLSRDRALQNIDFVIEAAQVRMKTAQDRLERLEMEADRFARLGKDAPGELNRERFEAADEVARLQSQIEKTRLEKADIRARYDADKQRFLELTANQ